MILPATTVRNPPAAPPEDIYVPMSTPVPIVTAPAPVPVPPAPAPATTPTPVPAPAPTPTSTMPPPPTPVSNSPTSIPPHVSRKLAHEGYVEMPRRTRGEIRALRDASREYVHRHGPPLDHAAMVSMLETGETIKSNCTPTRCLSGPADRACIGPTYTKQCVRRREVASCRHMATLHASTFNGLLQASTFALTPA